MATAYSYVVSPSVLGPIAADPDRGVDRLSASDLIALGARVVREVADLLRRSKESGKRQATLAVDTEVRFRSATDRAAFRHELTEAITELVSKYHDESAPGGVLRASSIRPKRARAAARDAGRRRLALVVSLKAFLQESHLDG